MQDMFRQLCSLPSGHWLFCRQSAILDTRVLGAVENGSVNGPTAVISTVSAETYFTVLTKRLRPLDSPLPHARNVFFVLFSFKKK